MRIVYTCELRFLFEKAPWRLLTTTKDTLKLLVSVRSLELSKPVLRWVTSCFNHYTTGSLWNTLTASLRRGKTPLLTSVPGMTLNYIWWWDSSQEVWWMWCSSSLPSLPRPLWPEVAVHVRVPFMRQVELFNHLLKIIMICYLKLYSCVQIIYIT